MSTFAAATGALAGTGKTGEAMAAGASRVKEAVTDGSWEGAYKIWKRTESMGGLWNENENENDRNIPKIPDEIGTHIPEICRQIDEIRQAPKMVKNTILHHITRAAVASGLVSEAAGAAGSVAKAAGSRGSAPAAAAAAGNGADMMSGMRGRVASFFPISKANPLTQSCPHCRKPIAAASPAAAAAPPPAAAAAPPPAVGHLRQTRYNRHVGRFRNVATGQFVAGEPSTSAVMYNKRVNRYRYIHNGSFAPNPETTTIATATPGMLTQSRTIAQKLLNRLTKKKSPRSRRFTYRR